MFLHEPSYMPCDECGVSLTRQEREGHVCARDDWARYQAFQLRDELEAFEDELGAFLESPEGMFALWDAERRRLDGLR